MKKLFHHIAKKSIINFLIFSLMLPASLAFLPQETEASTTQCIAEFFGMYAKSQVQEQTARAQAVPTVDVGAAEANSKQAAESQSSFTQDCIEHGLALAIGKMMLAQMTDQIVQWINGGFTGDPFFVTNPGDFLKDIGDQVVGEMILGSDLAFLCSPFKNHIKLALVLNYSSQYGESASERSKCTLSKVVDNMEKFYENFEEGGWAGWFALTMEPQNNAYGAMLEASSALELKIGKEESIKLAELNWGSGFLSQEECKDVDYEDATNNQAKYLKKQGDVLHRDDKTKKAKACQIVTPGKTIAGVLDKQLGVPADQLGLADDLDKILNALANQVFQKFLQGASGLLGSTQGGSSSSNSRRDWLAGIKSNTEEASTTAQKKRDDVNKLGNDIPTHEPSIPPTVNVAVRKTTEHSTAMPSHPSSTITDGDRKNYYDDDFKGYRSHHEEYPWTMVNLEKMIPIGKVVVYQRTNSENDARYRFRVTILNADKEEVWSEPIRHVQDYSTTYNITIPNITGQYVRIDLEDIGRLELAEIEVYPAEQVVPPSPEEEGV